MSEQIWETFDGLFKTLNKYARRIDELEARVEALEARLSEGADAERPVLRVVPMFSDEGEVKGVPA